MAVIAYDVGRTRSRAALYRGGVAVRHAERDTSATAVDGAAALGRSLGMLATELISEDPDELDDVTAVGIGSAGLAQAPDAEALVHALAEQYPNAEITVTSDMVTAHAGALGGRPGVVVAAGTGAVAFGRDGHGDTHQVDGWGYLLGDDGSGYAIGRAGLADALREHDGRGGSPALHRAAAHRFGDLGQLPSTVHRAINPARTVAAFAEDVLALVDGDERAARIVDVAAGALVDSAAAAAQALFGDAELDVSWTGGLFEGDRLLTPFLRRLRERLPHARLRPPAGHQLDGTRAIAQGAWTDYGERVLHAPPRSATSTTRPRTTGENR